MAFFILLALVAALIVYISLAPRKKRALIISAVILGAYMLYVRLTCGPDPRDVKVMKPMAEAISSYITKHGAPKSLQDIPNLPYRLEGCERKEEHLKGKYKSDYERVYLIQIIEKCEIKQNNKNIFLKMSYGKYPIDNEEYITLQMISDTTKTVAYMDMERQANSVFKTIKPIKFSSEKVSGICSPMKQ